MEVEKEFQNKYYSQFFSYLIHIIASSKFVSKRHLLYLIVINPNSLWFNFLYVYDI